ncbi:hypothetical protein DID80_07145 [Candidatus Marinamargulisbacteria bacterium SCGC AAA071-K20]|nr:hypothetical protein DID80_07145 [Candidatus Marinamargulisbacteria bacterium SCGC AAA071-K20]
MNTLANGLVRISSTTLLPACVSSQRLSGLAGNINKLPDGLSLSGKEKISDEISICGFGKAIVKPLSKPFLTPAALESFAYDDLVSKSATLIVSPNGYYKFSDNLTGSSFSLSVLQDEQLLEAILGITKLIKELPYIDSITQTDKDLSFTVILMNGQFGINGISKFYQTIHTDPFLLSGICTLNTTIPSRLVGYVAVGDYAVPVGSGKDSEVKMICHSQEYCLSSEVFSLVEEALKDPLVRLIKFGPMSSSYVEKGDTEQRQLEAVEKLFDGSSYSSVRHQVIIDNSVLKPAKKRDSRYVMNVSLDCPKKGPG